jgi:methionyl-tRNA synthetase
MGHVAGVYLPGDIYVKFLRLRGDECIFICGTDEHGVPITISAEGESTTPADVVARYHAHQAEAFRRLGIEFDIFSGTSTCRYHAEFSQEFFLSLQRAGHIEPRVTAQYYCSDCKRFLPDRYVEGSCPYCDSPEARGDQCEICGKALDSLKDPRCMLCGRRPEQRKTKHWFFRLDKYEERLKDWISGKTQWKENVRAFALGMLGDGLKPRSISRDLSWGVPLPVEEGEGKVLYVWFDAPIGYVSFTREFSEASGDPNLWKRYWLDRETRLVHFIGKDNIVFHAVIWPAMLMGQKEGYILPAEIPAFEYLHYKGGKFSKSKKRALWVHDYLEKYPPDLARFYLTAVAPETKDSNWTWEDFVSRVNTVLADIVGNFVNRTLTFAHKYFDGRVPEAKSPALSEPLRFVAEGKRNVDENLSTFRFREALKGLIDLAREGNRFFDRREPWARRTSDPAHAAATIAGALEIAAGLSVLAYPFLPASAVKLRRWLSLSEKPETADWKALGRPALEAGATLEQPELLFGKLDLDEILAAQGEAPAEVPERKEAPVVPETQTVPFKAFQQLDLRVASVKKAERVPGTDKLYRLEADIGGELRTMVAGIAPNYPDPAALVGKKIVVVTNLEPAKIRGILSTAMLLAAEHGDEVTLLEPEKDLPPGSRVH